MSNSESIRSATDLGERIQSLSQAINAAVAAGQAPEIKSHDVQELLAAAIRLYAAAQVDGTPYEALAGEEVVTQTEVAVTVSSLLTATRLELFEVAMWQVLGRP